jgi:5,10-methylenetetrahydromethanopterin reductase
VIRASVNVMPDGAIGDIVSIAVEAERLGFHGCWVYDEGIVMRDVYVLLAAIAQATDRVRIGTGITNPYTRHPATTAAAIATIDDLSGGRAFLGLGAGGSWPLEPLAVDRSQPLRVVRDTLMACRALFDGETVDMESKHFTLQGARLGFATRRGIEIWFAARGPKMLQLGGELCNGVMLDFTHRELIGDAVALVREGAARSGNRPSLMYSTMIATNDVELQAAKPHVTYRLVDSPPAVKERLGMTDNDSDRIRAALADGLEAAAAYVPDEWVIPFILYGTERSCADQLVGLMDRHGIDEYLVPVLDPATASATMATAARVLTVV